MKKIITCLFLLLCVTLYSQENFSFNKQYYLQKSKSQKVTAIALACTGAALMVTRNQMSVGENNTLATGTGVFRVLAFGCIGSSVHYFLRSAANKRTASANVFFDMQRKPTPGNTSAELMPAIGVKVGMR